MKKNLISIFLILCIPIVAFMAMSKTSAKSVNYNEVSGKPQVLKFTSTMCLDCQKMNNIFKEIFPKYSETIVLTEIPVQDKSSFSNKQIEKYNVTLVPTIILINSKGEQVKRIEGAIEKEEMEECLRSLN